MYTIFWLTRRLAPRVRPRWFHMDTRINHRPNGDKRELHARGSANGWELTA